MLNVSTEGSFQPDYEELRRRLEPQVISVVTAHKEGSSRKQVKESIQYV